MSESKEQDTVVDDAGSAELLRPATEGEPHGRLMSTLSILRACSTESRHAQKRLGVFRDAQKVYSKLEKHLENARGATFRFRWFESLAFPNNEVEEHFQRSMTSERSAKARIACFAFVVAFTAAMTIIVIRNDLIYNEGGKTPEPQRTTILAGVMATTAALILVASALRFGCFRDSHEPAVLMIFACVGIALLKVVGYSWYEVQHKEHLLRGQPELTNLGNELAVLWLLNEMGWQSTLLSLGLTTIVMPDFVISVRFLCAQCVMYVAYVFAFIFGTGVISVVGSLPRLVMYTLGTGLCTWACRKMELEQRRSFTALLFDKSLISTMSDVLQQQVELEGKLEAALSKERSKPLWRIEEQEVKLVSHIGGGSYGDVYVANWRGTTVAAKKMHPQHNPYSTGKDSQTIVDSSGHENLGRGERARHARAHAHMNSSTGPSVSFRSEMELLARLRHPNICLFLGAVETPTSFILVTEFVKLGSMWHLLHNNSAYVTPWRRLLMATEAALGLHTLHLYGVVHSDIKSANLLVTSSFHVKIADFGMSRWQLQTQDNSDNAHTNHITNANVSASQTYMQEQPVGTPAWCAPELMLSRQHCTVEADVYSFGICLWELATRCAPYGSMDVRAIQYRVAKEGLRPTVDKAVGGAFESSQPMAILLPLIERCWDGRPDRRPSSEQVLETLRRITTSKNQCHQQPQKKKKGAEFSVVGAQEEEVKECVEGDHDDGDGHQEAVHEEETGVALAVKEAEEQEQKKKEAREDHDGRGQEAKDVQAGQRQQRKQQLDDEHVTHGGEIGQLLQEQQQQQKQWQDAFHIAPHLLIDPHEILVDRVLHSSLGGGFVQKAYSSRQQSCVVLKSMIDFRTLQSTVSDASSLAAFKNEIEITTAIRHPNIVSCFGFVSLWPRLCIVLEYMERGSLHHVLHCVPEAKSTTASSESNNGGQQKSAAQPTPALEKVGPYLPFRHKLRILLDASAGIGHLHENNVVHRDLKTSNLLLSTTWTAKISDFRMSKCIASSVAKTRVGAPAYCAPEILQGCSGYTEVVDVYAFGVIANELLAEKLPFANVSLSVVELMTQIVNTHFRPKLAEFNDFATRRRSAPSNALACEHKAFDDICTLIQRCWDGDSSKRPTMLEIRTFLQALMERLAGSVQIEQQHDMEQQQGKQEQQASSPLRPRLYMHGNKGSK